MRWFEDFKEDMAAVFKEAAEAIARFPAPLDRRGLAYINGFNPLVEDSAKNYICYLLPFWLNDAAPITTAQRRALSLANVFVMLHFFVQDDVMDTAPEDWKEQLALGSLLQQEFQDRYRALFPSDSVFWTCARTMLTDWAANVTAENANDPFLHDPLRIAKKAAPLHMASVGAMLLAGREEQLSLVSELVDHTLVTLQMADDWADWQDDLADGSYNCLLSMIRFELSIDRSPTAAEVKHALYTRDVLVRYAELALPHYEALLHSAVRIPYLLDFHQSLIGQLNHDSNGIAEQRRILAAGGLHYFLAKNAKN